MSIFLLLLFFHFFFFFFFFFLFLFFSLPGRRLRLLSILSSFVITVAGL